MSAAHTETPTMHTGRCLCAGITFSISEELAPISVCYCQQCRRAQGGPLGTNIPVSAAAFTLSDPGQLLQSYESSSGKQRCFCRRCGSPVLSRRASVPGVVRVRAGLIDEPIGSGLGWHMHVASKCNWWPIVDDRPQFAEGHVPPAAA
jgi:hypothetical protein